MRLNVGKVKQRAKAKGLSTNFICSQIGMNNHYLLDVEKKNSPVPEDRVKKIADLLGTSVDFLSDITDDPEIKKDSADNWNGVRMSAERKKIMDVIASLSDEDVVKVEKILEAILGAEK